MSRSISAHQLKEMVTARLSHLFGVTPEEATYDQLYKSLAQILRDILREDRHAFTDKADDAPGAKRVYYLCMEFLMGRSLKNTLFNLNLTDAAQKAMEQLGVKLDRLYDCEPDAGLGNGGLGRLAACYLDALATQGHCSMGYSILYEYGIFKQKIIDGWQTEMPDFWLPGGEVWLVARTDKMVDVRFEGTVQDSWDEQYHHVELVGCKTVKAVPYDMMVAGKDGKGVSVLRLWSAKADGLDMNMFNQGDYVRAMEEKAMAEVISKVLYPADNHPEGKSLRLRQQYFLVSASVQDIVARHLRENGSLDYLPDKIAMHINDTHPTLAIPELMRIMLDECGYGWDDAYNIVKKVFAYTNHTVMKEALECWGEDLVCRLLPRIYQIIKELDNRLRKRVWDETGDADKVERMAIISNGAVRMANMCVAVCHSVNGVSSLHSEILKTTVFNDFYTIDKDKFTNVTNGIAHRRWLCQSNERLSSLITELIGGGFVYDAGELSKLREFANDSAVLEKLQEIKIANKADFAALVKAKTGVSLDPSSVFDVQAKRLHEYKRQHLNALNILAKYLEIKDNPNGDYVPQTYIFAAKAAPGYFMAKKIIEFICAIGDMINNDPDLHGLLKVIYLEDYNVTLAESLMPAADISEQISLAGTEASGTGNMKLMMNGAVTLGTMDGANIEIFNEVGADNIFVFGMNAKEVDDMRRNGYQPMNYYNNNAELHRIIEFANKGIAGKMFSEISGTIIHHDPYMVLADYADYRKIRAVAREAWKDRNRWNSISLMNIAASGLFSADRAVNEYAEKIWKTEKVL